MKGGDMLRRGISRMIFLGFLVICLVLACDRYDKGGPLPIVGVVTGQVLDTYTGEAVESAMIINDDTLNSRDIYWTDVTGHYTARANPDEDTIYCLHPEYVTKKVAVNVGLGEPTAGTADFYLVPSNSAK
jgi:hypothetical protein